MQPTRCLLHLELSHLVPLGLARNEGVDDGRGLHEVLRDVIAGLHKVVGLDVCFGSVVLEALDEDVNVVLISGAVPLEEEVAVLREGGVGEIRDELAEVCLLYTSPSPRDS